MIEQQKLSNPPNVVQILTTLDDMSIHEVCILGMEIQNYLVRAFVAYEENKNP